MGGGRGVTGEAYINSCPQAKRPYLRLWKAVALSFSVANQAIPNVLEEPIKSLGWIYNTSMDKKAYQRTWETSENGLLAIDWSRPAGKFKIWCLQSMLTLKLLCRLLIYKYEDSGSTGEEYERRHQEESEKVRMKSEYRKRCNSLNRAKGCHRKGPWRDHWRWTLSGHWCQCVCFLVR